MFLKINLSPLFLMIAMLCFILPFVVVSCDETMFSGMKDPSAPKPPPKEQVIASVRGYQMAAGLKPDYNMKSELGKMLSENDTKKQEPSIAKPETSSTKKPVKQKDPYPPNKYLLMSFFGLLVAFAVSFSNKKASQLIVGVGSVIGIAGLFLFKANILQALHISPELKGVVMIKFTYYFWLAMVFPALTFIWSMMRFAIMYSPSYNPEILPLSETDMDYEDMEDVEYEDDEAHEDDGLDEFRDRYKDLNEDDKVD